MRMMKRLMAIRVIAAGRRQVDTELDENTSLPLPEQGPGVCWTTSVHPGGWRQHNLSLSPVLCF